MLFLVDWPGGSWEATLKGTIAIVAVYLAAIWLAVLFWTYRDIRRRSRDPIVQAVAVLAVLLFFLPGLWIYQILRPRYTLNELYERSLEEEALLQDLEDQKACPTCKRRVRDDYLICPSCRTTLKEACAHCDKPLNYAWSACPYCGTEKQAREGMGARPVRSPLTPARPVVPQRPATPLATAARPATPAAQPRRVLGQGLRPKSALGQAPASGEEAPPIDTTVD